MPDAPEIPYGYKRLPPGTATQRGDGVWDGERFVRLLKRANVNTGLKETKYWPVTDDIGIVIRRCIVEQPELIHVESAANQR